MIGQIYDVVLLPDDTITKRAIDLSKQLSSEYPMRFSLNQTTVPHYSIYMAQLTQDGVEEAKEKLKGIAQDFSTFSLEATKYWQDMDQGFFEVQYARTPQLIALQEQVITAINPLREGRFLAEYPPGFTKEEQREKLTGNALAQFTQFAYPEIGEDYRPHMTFTRLQEETYATKIITKLPHVASFSGSFPSLGLFVMGHNGTCVQHVSTWAMKQQHR